MTHKIKSMEEVVREVEMPPYKRGKEMKIGEKYFFVDTNFEYMSIPPPKILQATVYQIRDDDYTTKELGDRYAVERYFAFVSEEDARQYALRELMQYKDYLIKKVDLAIEALTITNVTSRENLLYDNKEI